MKHSPEAIIIGPGQIGPATELHRGFRFMRTRALPDELLGRRRTARIRERLSVDLKPYALYALRRYWFQCVRKMGSSSIIGIERFRESSRAVEEIDEPGIELQCDIWRGHKLRTFPHKQLLQIGVIECPERTVRLVK